MSNANFLSILPILTDFCRKLSNKGSDGEVIVENEVEKEISSGDAESPKKRKRGRPSKNPTNAAPKKVIFVVCIAKHERVSSVGNVFSRESQAGCIFYDQYSL